MKKRCNILLLSLISLWCIGQERIMISSGYIVIDKGTTGTPSLLVIDNPNSNAIQRTAGGIITDATTTEFNQVQWDIGTSTGTYTIPFQYSTTNYIPVTFNNTGGAGTGASGTVRFSTYHGTNAVAHGCTGGGGANISDNMCYEPFDVTNMNPNTATTLPTATDDSYYVADRFWIVDPSYGTFGNPAYTVYPNPILTFTYLNGGAATEVGGSNAGGLDGTLITQRFNSTKATWGDWLGPAGHDNTAFGANTGQVTTNTQIGVANFFRSWALSDNNAPLPIDLTAFTVECENFYALIQWTTATEVNNDFFTIERTQDGVNYETVAVIKGAGTTSTSRNYSTVDYSPYTGTSYYRISQTDLDGTTKHLNTAVFTPCENAESVNVFAMNNNGIDVQINASIGDTYTITLMNDLGQVVLTEDHNASIGLNDYKIYKQVSYGIYILQIKGSQKVYTKKLALGRI